MDADDPDVVLAAIATYLRLLDYRAKITGLYTVKPPRPAVVAAIGPTRDPEQVLAGVQRFLVLTPQMREQNKYGRCVRRCSQPRARSLHVPRI